MIYFISRYCSYILFSSLQVQMVVFMERVLNKITTLPTSLTMLSRFEWYSSVFLFSI